MEPGYLTWADLVPDSLQGWQEHEEQMDRFSELREVELEAGSEELLCDCVQRDLDLNNPQDRLSAGGTGAAVPASMAVA